MKNLGGLIFLIFALMGCGQQGAGIDPKDQIVAITPANGALGVNASEAIKVVFAKPVDKAAIEASYQSPSSGLGPSEVDFVWEQGNTVLQIKPKQPLQYAELSFVNIGANGYIAMPESDYTKELALRRASLEPVRYTFSIAGLESSFSTLRKITETVQGGGGTYFTNPNRKASNFPQASQSIAIGNYAPDDAAVGFLGFSLFDFPSQIDAANILEAQLKVNVEGNTNDSIANLLKSYETCTNSGCADLYIEHIDIDPGHLQDSTQPLSVVTWPARRVVAKQLEPKVGYTSIGMLLDVQEVWKLWTQAERYLNVRFRFDNPQGQGFLSLENSDYGATRPPQLQLTYLAP